MSQRSKTKTKKKPSALRHWPHVVNSLLASAPGMVLVMNHPGQSWENCHSDHFLCSVLPVRNPRGEGLHENIQISKWGSSTQDKPRPSQEAMGPQDRSQDNSYGTVTTLMNTIIHHFRFPLASFRLEAPWGNGLAPCEFPQHPAQHREHRKS